MEGLTSMFFATLEKDENFDPDEPIILMSEATTRTLRHQEAVLEKVTIMRQKMETLWLGDLHGQAQNQLLRLRISGALSAERKMSQIFGNLLRNWILRHSPQTSAISGDLSIGGLNQSEWSMNTQVGSNLTLEQYLTSLYGEMRLLEMEL